MKKYSLIIAALFFSACVSNNTPASNTPAPKTSANNCINTDYIDKSDHKSLSCTSVVKDKNGRKVVNLELTNLTKSDRHYKLKITWKDADGMVTSDTKERLTTDYVTINARDSKNILFLAPNNDSVDFKILVTKIKEIPKGALYDKKNSKMGDNDFAIAADALVKTMHVKKIRSEDFLNCGSINCKIFVEQIKNRTRTNFPVKIIREELINAIQDYELADYTDAISGDGNTNTSYAINKTLEGNEDFNQDMIVQSGQLQGPTHALSGSITQNTDLSTGQVAYYLDMSISNLRTGTVEWKGREKIVGKKL